MTNTIDLKIPISFNNMIFGGKREKPSAVKIKFRTHSKHFLLFNGKKVTQTYLLFIIESNSMNGVYSLVHAFHFF